MSLLLPRQTLRREQASWRMNGKRLCLRQHTNLLNPKLRHVTRHTCRSLNRVQAKELTELRAQVEQGKTVESCLRQELDDLNKVFPSPRPHTWPRP